jgi:hypothetical protein
MFYSVINQYEIYYMTKPTKVLEEDLEPTEDELDAMEREGEPGPPDDDDEDLIENQDTVADIDDEDDEESALCHMDAGREDDDLDN